ncbi:MAG: hypothetical protein LBP62_01580, partial [Clostridiales bacterium]|nr:hypothetical protein [Clostridiales bacterium]
MKVFERGRGRKTFFKKFSLALFLKKLFFSFWKRAVPRPKSWTEEKDYDIIEKEGAGSMGKNRKYDGKFKQ